MPLLLRIHSLTAAAAAGGEIAWEGEIAFEGVDTSDDRRIAPGALVWRELPLSLMAQTETAPGHDGARLAGRIDAIERRDGGVIFASGAFVGEYGAEIASMVETEALRGVSVDMAVLEYEIEPSEEAADDEGDGDALDLLFGPTETFVVLSGEIMGATLTPFPAFADARLRVVSAEPSAVDDASGEASLLVRVAGGVEYACAECAETARLASMVHEAAQAFADHLGRPVSWSTEQGEESVEMGHVGRAVPRAWALTASAAGAAPPHPPAAWFDDPALEGPTPLTVTDDGRVFGHLATWGTCHIGLPGCRTAPRSASGYAFFNLGEVVTAEGRRVAAGKITLGGPHADLRASRVEAQRHYDDSCLAVADVVAGEDEHGIWLAGAVRPDAPVEQVRALRAAPISGDWRTVNGRLELVGALGVNVPGFPVPRALVASGAAVAVVGRFAGEVEAREPVVVPLSLVRRAGVLDRLAARAR